MRYIWRRHDRRRCPKDLDLIAVMYGDAKCLIDDAVQVGVFPAAVVEVGSASGCQWTHAAGTIVNDTSEDAVSQNTVFDLASLTKVIATTTLAIRQVDALALDLQQKVGLAGDDVKPFFAVQNDNFCSHKIVKCT